MDDVWIYGSEPDQIYSTIVQGRPNGMPAFGARIPRQQVWQLVAFVRSLSGGLRKDVEPGRTDSMQMRRRAFADARSSAVNHQVAGARGAAVVAAIAELFWVFVAVAAVVYLLVIVLSASPHFGGAMRRRARERRCAPCSVARRSRPA